MRRSRLSFIITVFVLLSVTAVLPAACGADASGKIYENEQIEVPGDRARKIEAAEKIKQRMHPKKIEERKRKMPEIPRAITRTRLAPAEKVELDQLEQDYARGKITQTEYEMKRDTLYRQANITF